MDAQFYSELSNIFFLLAALGVCLMVGDAVHAALKRRGQWRPKYRPW